MNKVTEYLRQLRDAVKDMTPEEAAKLINDNKESIDFEVMRSYSNIESMVLNDGTHFVCNEIIEVIEVKSNIAQDCTVVDSFHYCSFSYAMAA